MKPADLQILCCLEGSWMKTEQDALSGVHCGDLRGEALLVQGTKLMTPEKARGVWAIYVWCRRTDELVDGPNASRMNPRVGSCPGS